MLWLSGRRKKAQLFRCKDAASNAVNAYPMPNRHEGILPKATSQSVRMRHFGRHKCREPAITAWVECFLIKGAGEEFQENPTQRRTDSLQNGGVFSRYTVAGETPGNVCFGVGRRQMRDGEGQGQDRCQRPVKALRKSVDSQRIGELASQLFLTRPLRRHSLCP